MLLNNFYKVADTGQSAEGQYTAHVVLNKDHEVFKGHFPDNPVTPGVCMMQIVKELCEDILQCSLMLKTASNVKFMALINPEINPDLRLELTIVENENAEIKVKNATYFDDTVALKLTNTYIKQ